MHHDVTLLYWNGCFQDVSMVYVSDAPLGHADSSHPDIGGNISRRQSSEDKATQSFDVHLAMLVTATLLLIGSVVCFIMALCEVNWLLPIETYISIEFDWWWKEKLSGKKKSHETCNRFDFQNTNSSNQDFSKSTKKQMKLNMFV